MRRNKYNQSAFPIFMFFVFLKIEEDGGAQKRVKECED
jgi:hypothetical protein